VNQELKIIENNADGMIRLKQFGMKMTQNAEGMAG